MLHRINELKDYVISAEDGEIGQSKDFLFDDRHWAIRYMVADTGKWLPGRKVLVTPIALGKPDWEARRFPVQLTQQEIKESPPLDEDAPVSRDNMKAVGSIIMAGFTTGLEGRYGERHPTLQHFSSKD